MGPVAENYRENESLDVNLLGGGLQSKVNLKDALPAEDDGRFEGGFLVDAGDQLFPILASTTTYVVVRNPEPGTGPRANARVVLWDDDDQTLLPEAPDLGLMQEAYAAAFILPVVDGGGDPANNKMNVPFQLNVPQHGDDPELANNEIKAQIQAQNGLESDANRSKQFWVGYVQSAYQGEAKFDYDPSSDGWILGCAPEDRTKGALVFVETTRDYAQKRGFSAQLTLLKQRVVVHEVAHNFGVNDNQGADDSVMHVRVLMDPRHPDGYTFNEDQILTLRAREKSPGS